MKTNEIDHQNLGKLIIKFTLKYLLMLEYITFDHK